jgi:hypothetical protein
MTSTNNKDKTYAQKFYELNQNTTRVADPRNWTAYHERIREQTGGLNSAFNQINASFNIQSRPFVYNQNFLGLKSSHYVPNQGRFQWDLYESIDSRQRTPDSQFVFVQSQIPKQFS